MSVKNKDVVITLKPSNRQIFAVRNRRLSDLIREADLPLGFSCGGRGICTACVVQVCGLASAITRREATLLSQIADSEQNASGDWSARIACLTRVIDTLEVKTTYW